MGFDGGSLGDVHICCVSPGCRLLIKKLKVADKEKRAQSCVVMVKAKAISGTLSLKLRKKNHTMLIQFCNAENKCLNPAISSTKKYYY